MKKIPLYILLLSYLLSCQQDNPIDPTPSKCNEPVAYLKFKLNGTLIEINGSWSQNGKEGSIIRKEQVLGTGHSNPLDDQNGDALNNTNYCFSLLATKNFFYSDDGEPILEIEFRASSIVAPSTYIQRLI
jgi:hypothetical protein